MIEIPSKTRSASWELFPMSMRSMEGVGSAMRQDPDFHSMIEGFVTSPHFDSSIFDAAAIRVLLEQHCAGERDHSSLLARVATFAVGLPYFAYDRPRRCPGEARP